MMDEKNAWDNFCKTGSIESYLEYKSLKDNLKVGENSIEANKSEGDNNKRNSL